MTDIRSILNYLFVYQHQLCMFGIAEASGCCLFVIVKMLLHAGSTTRRWSLSVERTLSDAATPTAAAGTAPGPTPRRPSRTSTSSSCLRTSGAFLELRVAFVLVDSLFSRAQGGNATIIELWYRQRSVVHSSSESWIFLVTCRTKKKWNGPLQYEDPSKQLMMLPTDLVRPQTPHSRAHSYHSIYAAVQPAAEGTVVPS